MRIKILSIIFFTLTLFNFSSYCQIVDSILVNGLLYLKRDFRSELNLFENHVHDHQILHLKEWGNYLSSPHPSFQSTLSIIDSFSKIYNVPSKLLISIAYVENNFTHIGPSIDYGWGMMHLTDNDYSSNLSLASSLTSISKTKLKKNVVLNIQGAAALLKYYHDRTLKMGWESWFEASAQFSGLFSSRLRNIQAQRYFSVMLDGIESVNLWGEKISVPKFTNPELKSIFLSKSQIDEEDGRSAEYGPALSSFTTCNFTNGRNHSIDTWVNHWIGTGTAAGAVSWFQNCNANASAHFVVNNSGTIYQVVGVTNTAWHCGASGFPYNNGRSIGVEHEATLANPSLWNSTPMLQASAQMACFFSNLYSIPTTNPTSPGICGHQNMPGTNTSCPGSIPWSTWFSFFNNGNCNSSSSNPPNDYCGNAENLNVYGLSCTQATQGSVLNATQSTSPILCDGFTSFNALDVWYRFVANASTHVITVAPSSGLDAVVEIRTACPGQSIDCQDSGGGEGATETLTVTGLNPGTTYYVRVYDYSGTGTPATTTTFTICVTTPCISPTMPMIAGSDTFVVTVVLCYLCQTRVSGCSYNWSNGFSGNSIQVNQSGNYTVTATNPCGSISSNPFAVVQVQTPTPQFIDLSNVYCLAKPSFTLNATPSGGSFSGPGVNGNVFTPSLAGVGTHNIQYTVVAAGCSSTIVQNITITNTPLVLISKDDTSSLCINDTVNLTATQGESYFWSTGDTTISIAVTSSGSYQVTVTNPGGCIAQVSALQPINAYFNSLPIVNAGIDITLVNHPDSSIILGGSPSAYGGNSPYSYVWLPQFGLSDASQSNPSLCCIANSTSYKLSVEDALGCKSEDSIFVTVIPSCNYSVIPQQFSFENTGGFDSVWINFNSSSCSDIDFNSCSWIQWIGSPFPVTQSSWLYFNILPNLDTFQRQCTVFSNSSDLSFTITQDGNINDPCTPPLSSPDLQLNFCDFAAELIQGVSYQWYYNGIPIQGANSRFFTVDQQGYYYVQISDSNFCTSQSDDVYVLFPDCLPNSINSGYTSQTYVYYNSTSSDLIFKTKEIGKSILSFKIFNSLGELMYNYTEGLNADIFILNTSKFSNGMYFILIENNEDVLKVILK